MCSECSHNDRFHTCTAACPHYPDPEVTLPPYTRDGYTECPKCKGQAKTFNCGCIRCDQPDCYYIVIDANCGAEFGYGSAGAPWM